MVVERRALKTGEELPPNSRLLDADEMEQILVKEVEAYKPSRDMLPLKYASVPIMLSAAACASIIHGRFLRFFKFRGNLATFSYLPVVVPSVAASTTIHTAITSDILHGETLCPVCVETRAISFQALFGGIYPTIISPTVCAALLTPRGLTPSLIIKDNVMATLAHIRKRPKVYIAATFISGLVGGIVTYLEQNAAWKLRAALYAKYSQDLKKTEFEQ